MTHKLDVDIFGKVNPITHKSELKNKHINIFNIFVFIYFDYFAKFKKVSFKTICTKHFNLKSVSIECDDTVEIAYQRGTL